MSDSQAIKLSARPPWARRGIVATGVLGACALGVALGFWARPELALPGLGRPMTPYVRKPGDADQIQVTINTAQPPAVPLMSGELLETLPPEMVAPSEIAAPPPGALTLQIPQFQAPLPVEAEEPPRPAEPPPAAVAPRAIEPPRPVQPSRAAEPPRAAQPARAPQAAQPAPRPRPAPRPVEVARSPCDNAAPGADRMICNDASLAAADQAMNRALRRALEAGIPSWKLRRQQERWRDVRETAAQAGAGALAQAYGARIADLQDQAARGRPLPGAAPTP